MKTLAELLTGTDGWTPPDLSDVTGVAQPHCHQHAVLGWDADKALLANAGATIKAVGGCCGLAGNFGVERGHYDVSVAVAETALLPAVREAVTSRPSRRRQAAAARRSWPTASPAAPSSTSWPASTAPTWPSCWPSASARPPGTVTASRAPPPRPGASSGCR